MKRFIAPIGVALCVLIILCTIFFYHGIAIYPKGKKVSFYMTNTLLWLIKGAPSEKQHLEEIDGIIWCYEQDELLGHTATSEFWFSKPCLTRRLTMAIYSIDNLDLKTGEMLFYQLNEECVKQYSGLDDYYHHPIDDQLLNEGTLSTSLGTDNGATGISIDILFSNGELSLTSFIQE